MRIIKRLFFVVGLYIFFVSCRPTAVNQTDLSGTASEQPTPLPTSTAPATPNASPVATTAAQPQATTTSKDDSLASPLVPLTFAEFPNAGSIDFTLTDDGRIYLAYGRDSNIYVTQSADGGATFEAHTVASSEANVFVFGLERPAIAVGPNGRVHVAWPEASYPGSIWYAASDDGGETFTPARRLSEPGPETVLVRFALRPDGAPAVAWLQNSGLSFTRADASTDGFQPDRVIDDQTCDCCHPQPLWVDDNLYIAYRNLVIDDTGQHIRDIYLVKSSDAGDSFAEPVRVSDAPWFIAACPFAGPSLIADSDKRLYVSWMDGRDDDGTLTQTDIWLATSEDSGQTFSTNRRINNSRNVYNNLPSLAIDAAGRLHVIWQASEADRHVLYHTVSNDAGQTFAPPQRLVDSTKYNGRRPSNASLFIDEHDVLYASWVDGANGYLASWQVQE